jgi:hypothetical protein
MYLQVLFLLYFYMWALVELWIRCSRIEESFPPILCMPWLGGNAIYGALFALNNTYNKKVSAHNPQHNLAINRLPWT